MRSVWYDKLFGPNGLWHRRMALAASAAIIVCVGLLIVNSGADARSVQRPRDVVAIQCDAGFQMCQALVQALAETAPRMSFRLNPDPVPPQGFVVTLVTDAQGASFLQWQGGGQGNAVSRKSHSAAEFARQIVAASPALTKTLNKS